MLPGNELSHFITDPAYSLVSDQGNSSINQFGNTIGADPTSAGAQFSDFSSRAALTLGSMAFGEGEAKFTTEIESVAPQVERELAQAGTAAAKTEGNVTRLGIARNNPADWRATRDLWDSTGYSEILSEANRAAIARGRTPVVDQAWIQHFPEDAGLVGERIPMHHIGGGPITVPLPFTRHVDAHMPGGFGTNPGGPGSALPVYPASGP